MARSRKRPEVSCLFIFLAAGYGVEGGYLAVQPLIRHMNCHEHMACMLPNTSPQCENEDGERERVLPIDCWKVGFGSTPQGNVGFGSSPTVFEGLFTLRA